MLNCIVAPYMVLGIIRASSEGVLNSPCPLYEHYFNHICRKFVIIAGFCTIYDTIYDTIYGAKKSKAIIAEGAKGIPNATCRIRLRRGIPEAFVIPLTPSTGIILNCFVSPYMVSYIVQNPAIIMDFLHTQSK